MKPGLLLILSLAANLVLVALLLRPTQVNPPTTAPELNLASTPATPEPPTTESPHQVVTNTLVRKITWEQVESPDYRQYIQNLRSIGCPDETIRDIILADVNKLYDSKRKQVRGASRKFEYWKAGNPLTAMLGDSDSLKQRRLLEEEKLKVLNDLGIQPDAMNQLMAAAGGNAMDAMFDFLPESKRIEVTKVMTEQQTKMAENMKDGAPDPEAFMTMQKETEDALRATLTPEEFQDYQLRFSMTANMLRQQITGFDPSEEEFLKVFKIKEEFDRTYSPFGSSNETEAEQRKRSEAQTQLNNQIRESLGPERYADYERAQDYSYQQLYQIAKKAELPPTVANEVYGMKRAAENQANQIRSDVSLTQAQRSAALAAIRTETERSMQQTLGDSGWEQYNRPNNTWWLRNMAPNSANTPVPSSTVIHDTVIIAPTP